MREGIAKLFNLICFKLRKFNKDFKMNEFFFT